MMRTIYLLIATVFMLSSCLTGGFDQNEQLDEHKKALAKAPKVESISINGEELERDTESRWVVEAAIDDDLVITAHITSGKGAELEEIEFSRIYYYGESFEEDAQPVDPSSADGIITVSGKEYDLSYTYTVPEEDDDGYAFEAGYVIQIYFLVKNDLENYGYKAFEVHIVD